MQSQAGSSSYDDITADASILESSTSSKDSNGTIVDDERLRMPFTQGIERLILIDEKEIRNADTTAALGKGGFGVVFRAKYQNMDVAVKSFTSQQSITAAHKDEMMLMKSLNHVNLVRLYGLVCDEQRRPTKLVMEYGWYGDLYNFISNYRRNNCFLPWELRTKIAYDLACGLAYLHSKHVVHRDIKSQNVVLDMNGTAKWCDFGLSVLKLSSTPLDQHHYDAQQAQAGNIDLKAQGCGTLLYLAPELFVRGTSEPSRASDIWAYGMVCYELVAMQLPFLDELLHHEDSQTAIKVAIVTRSPPLQLPVDCFAPFQISIVNCWNAPASRPRAQALVDYWASILDQLIPRPQQPTQQFQQQQQPQQNLLPTDLLMQSVMSSWTHS